MHVSAWDLIGSGLPILAVLVFAWKLPAWGFMWLLAWAVWMACKYLTWREEAQRCVTVSFKTFLIYFLFWPGMDARPFLHPAKPQTAGMGQWLAAGWMTFLGAALIWSVARRVATVSMFWAGWVGMLGAVLVLHFGTFRLMALVFRSLGILVEPIMKRPTRSTSLADFWKRWNLGFRDFAYRLIFKPVHRRAGIVIATMAVFVFSGFVHDLIISLPPRAGFGLPTMYFILQGCGVLFEKTAMGKRMGPLGGRIFTYIMVLAPLGILFHGAFVRSVFVPFLVAIRAI